MIAEQRNLLFSFVYLFVVPFAGKMHVLHVSSAAASL